MSDERKVITIRGVPADVQERLSRSAAARGITQAEYLGSLLSLHVRCLEAEAGSDDVRRILAETGLTGVTV